MKKVIKQDVVTYHEFLEALAVVKAFRRQIGYTGAC